MEGRNLSCGTREDVCFRQKVNSKCKDSGDEHGVYVFKIKMINEKGDRS